MLLLVIKIGFVMNIIIHRGLLSLDEYKLISPDDIPQLADCGEMNFNNVGLTYITQLRACLLKPEVSAS